MRHGQFQKNKFNFIFISTVLIVCFITLFLLAIKKPDNTKNAKITIGYSKIYSEEEIKSAINIVLDRFKEFPATLNKLYYDEMKSQLESYTWIKQYDADESIVLYSDFKTYSGESTESRGLIPDREYKDWSWVLVRVNRGDWQLKTWGY